MGDQDLLIPSKEEGPRLKRALPRAQLRVERGRSHALLQVRRGPARGGACWGLAVGRRQSRQATSARAEASDVGVFPVPSVPSGGAFTHVPSIVCVLVAVCRREAWT